MSKTAHDTLDPHETLSLDEAHSDHHHVTPFWTMTNVFIALVILTVVTVLTAEYVHLPGSGNIIVAMVIAILKALLVAGFFMHLLFDRAMNTIVVGATLFAVVLFIGLTAIDMGSRPIIEKTEQGEIRSGGSLQNYAGDLHFPLTGRTIDKADKSVTELARENGHAAEHNPPAEGGEHAAPAAAPAHGAAPAPASAEPAKPH